jgi:hypothetical protein
VSLRPWGRRAPTQDLRTQACIVLAACVLALLASPESATAAQLGEAEANEVKHVDEHGSVHFDLPPPSKTPAPARAPGMSGAVYYIQTEVGLMEWSSHFIRAGACRAAIITAAMMSDPFLGKSFYGAHWIVKRGGRWLDCHGPRTSDVCEPFRDFPFPRQ